VNESKWKSGSHDLREGSRLKSDGEVNNATFARFTIQSCEKLSRDKMSFCDLTHQDFAQVIFHHGLSSSGERSGGGWIPNQGKGNQIPVHFTRATFSATQ
jgi:hypothetical protein